MRKILFTRQSECLQPLRQLVEQQNHRTLVLWALDCAVPILGLFEQQFSNDMRPRQALAAAWDWAQGKIKMPVAKKAIHLAHNAATEAEGVPTAQAAARAVGHAAATVHVETHALGIVFYGLTAFVYACAKESDSVVNTACDWFYQRLLYWQAASPGLDITWAPFLLRDDVPNKELLLRKKLETN